MTINEPSLDPNKDTATLAWEKSVTEATNRMQHQIDNINESVNTSPSLVAVYARTLEGKGQQFTPFEEANGYVAYVPYTDAYPTLPLVGVTFAEYSNKPVNFVIKQYRETQNRPDNPGSVQYTVSDGSWTASQFWDKTKLNRSGTNIWFCEARIIGTTGEQVTAKWSDPKLLYGGAVATGILYYNVAATDADKPSAPSVDTSGTATSAVIVGYDYDSGTFTLGNSAALSTLGWQYVPITVAMSGANSINKKHWQVSFHVETLEVTNETGNAPGQIITFGTVEGFIPIGSVLQSDNYSDQAGSLAGWQIDRSGNADFNNVNIRGNSTVAGSLVAGDLTSATIAADKISSGTISSDRIDSTSISAANINADKITTGNLTATNVNFGVIMQVVQGAYSGNSTAFATLTATNNDNFSTFLVIIANVSATTGSSDEQDDGSSNNSTVSNSLTVSGSGITTLNVGVSLANSNRNKQNSATKKSETLTKGATYTATGSVSGSYNFGGSGNVLMLEVKL
tara:strand:+ start:11678 stop:13210 length:1533 start_codon:yes stop_codon:yes gene_type:complete